MEEPSQFSMGQTAQSRTCATMEKPHTGKGASIYDVRTEGGGGVSPKEDVVREVA